MYSISPAKPPLPWPRKRPFQPPCGNQTSIAISESALGVAFTITRQNAGSDFQEAGSPASHGERSAGGVKPPAATASAATTLASGSVSAATALHESGAGAVP